MANRIVGNVYIIDSQTAGKPLIDGTSGAWLRSAYISAIGFWAADTSGVFELAYRSDTTNVVFKLALEGATGTNGFSTMKFIGGVRFEELTAKTLTAGTGWIYFL